MHWSMNSELQSGFMRTTGPAAACFPSERLYSALCETRARSVTFSSRESFDVIGNFFEIFQLFPAPLLGVHSVFSARQASATKQAMPCAFVVCCARDRIAMTTSLAPVGPYLCLVEAEVPAEDAGPGRGVEALPVAHAAPRPVDPQHGRALPRSVPAVQLDPVCQRERRFVSVEK